MCLADSEYEISNYKFLIFDIIARVACNYVLLSLIPKIFSSFYCFKLLFNF